jgi:hypothetical protein
MKKIVFILIMISTLSFNSCDVYSTATSTNWFEYELQPSKIQKNGNVFFEGTFSDGSKFSVFANKEIDDEARYYYVNLMQDFGWRKVDDKNWSAPQGSREYKLGHIYINPNRRVALYFDPEGKYSAYKLNIN